jgi:hypothetical protein
MPIRIGDGIPLTRLTVTVPEPRVPGATGPDPRCPQPPGLMDLAAQPADSLVTRSVNNVVRYY